MLMLDSGKEIHFMRYVFLQALVIALALLISYALTALCVWGLCALAGFAFTHKAALFVWILMILLKSVR